MKYNAEKKSFFENTRTRLMWNCLHFIKIPLLTLTIGSVCAQFERYCNIIIINTEYLTVGFLDLLSQAKWA